MNLKILSVEQARTVNVAWIEINTPVGNFIIQDGYTPTIFMLAQGKPLILCLADNSQETIDIKNGILEIDRIQATLLLY